MMTGANVSRSGFVTMRRRELAVSTWCSAGCSNALRVGDRATAFSGYPPGTINIAVAINCKVSAAVLAEALQLAVEARVLAVQQALLVSVRSSLPATGTGTDCIVVAAPDVSGSENGRIGHCGKHTVLGELIGRAVLKCCTIALIRRRD
jgi:adenosylcobinamide kinase/adenosylcobinamide-phosphate guanylyltransferase